jgi:hypothetical protein
MSIVANHVHKKQQKYKLPLYFRHICQSAKFLNLTYLKKGSEKNLRIRLVLHPKIIL